MPAASQTLLPHWSKAGGWSLGRDPLGIQATSVRMYRALVPGLTNVTNRLRYYSFYCWVVALWETLRHSDDELEWCLFIRRAEALYALACESVDENTPGLAGSEWARSYWKEFEGTAVDLVPYTDRPGESNNQYLKAKRGNFGQFYVASMLEVKLLDPSKSIPIVANNGKELANAFAAAIGKHVASQLEKAVDSGKLSLEVLQEIGEAVHPARLEEDSEEIALLRNFLLSTKADIQESNGRWMSAWLLLDLARKGVPIFNGHALRRAFYQRTLPDGKPYRANVKIIDLWRAYHANELCHIALEALLNGMTTALRSQAGGLAPSELLGDLVKSIMSTRERKIPWAEWASTVADGTPDAEETLSSIVLDGLKHYKERSGDSDVLLSAAKLLGVLWHRWNTGAHQVQAEVARFSVRSGSSLAGVLATLGNVSNSSTDDALEVVLRRHVIAEHLAIAGQKVALSGKYTYRFVLEDGVLSDGVVAEYGYTNPRLANLATFLVDAKLIDDTGNVTASGQNILNDLQPA